jgi:hypothetical protein
MKFIVAYAHVKDSRNFKSTLVSRLDGNPTLPKDQLTQIKDDKLYMKPKLLTTTNRDTILNLGYDHDMCFLNTREA